MVYQSSRDSEIFCDVWNVFAVDLLDDVRDGDFSGIVREHSDDVFHGDRGRNIRLVECTPALDIQVLL